MSNINKFLANILAARYGKDVRQAIHDAIHQCYEDGKAGSIDLIARESIEDLQGDVSKLSTDAVTLDSKVKAIDSKVDLLDIKKTTSSTLQNSKHGGARLTKVVGNTEQKKYSGKNLLENTFTPQTINGATFSSDNYGRVKANGTPTVDVYKGVGSVTLPSGNYIVSGCKNGATSNYYVFLQKNGAYFINNLNGDTTFTLTEEATINYLIAIRSGKTVTNVEFEPMIRKADITDDTYEPYIGGVELIQGARNTTTGVVTNTNLSVTGNNIIPCKTGDVVSITYDTSANIKAFRLAYYNNGTFVSVSSECTSGFKVNIPDGVNGFGFNINSNGGDITPQTVGKVTLTVNGKPIYVHSGAYEGGMTSPSPYYPQSMYHTSDVVEMIQGGYSWSKGTYSSSDTIIGSKNTIPCKANDVIKLYGENATTVGVVYYNNGEYVSYAYNTNGNSLEVTVPSGVTEFNINILNSNGITPDTVGKITLTINGKYVNCVRGHGKNFWKHGDQDISVRNILNVDIPKGTYTFSALITSSDTDAILSRVSFSKADGTYTYITLHRNARTFGTFTIDEDIKQITLFASTNSTLSQGDTATFKDIQLELGETMTDFDPFKETVAYFLTEKPMMADSHLFREDGLVKVEHGATEIVIDSTTPSNHISIVNESTGLIFIAKAMADLEPIACTQFTKYNETGISIESNSQASKLKDGQFSKRYGHTHDRIYFRHSGFTSVEDVVTYLKTNSIVILCKTTTPYIETLDTESQLALHGLKTFDNVTYLDFDSRVKPKEIEVEYGTSQVGARTLKNENDNDIDRVEREEMKTRLDEMAVMIVAMGSEV